MLLKITEELKINIKKECLVTFIKNNFCTYIAQSFLTEGTPFVFQDYPFLFEEIRRSLAYNIKTECKLDYLCYKDIGLTGSAQLGYSFYQGTSYTDKSDLDFFIVSNKLFDTILDEYQRFKLKFGKKEIKGNKHTENNIKLIDNNLNNGFIDRKYIGNFDITKNSQIIGQILFRLRTELLNLIKKSGYNFIMNPEKAIDVRIYKDWDSLIARLSFNLKSSIKNK